MATPVRSGDDAPDPGEELARRVALMARISRNKIAERLEAEGEMTLAWFYRSTIV